MRITKHCYTGYLIPWLRDINRLWCRGYTTTDIAVIICKKIEEQPEKLSSYYQRQKYIPMPSSAMIRYVLERTHSGPIAKRPHPYDYPTAARWRLLLPPELAHEQARWERLRDMHNMRELGFTLEKIGQQIGISRERIRQLMLHPLDPYSPLELYLCNNTDDFKVLAKSTSLRAYLQG